MSTAAEILAIEGLLNDTALDVSYLYSVIDAYSTHTNISLVQQAISDAAGLASTPMDQIGSTTMPSFTGVTPHGYSTIDQNDLSLCITTHGDTLLGNDLGQFAQLLSIAKSYSDTATESLQVIQAADDTSNDLSFDDTISYGLANLVSDSSKLPKLGNAIKRIGKLFNYNNLQLTGTARDVGIQLLINYDTEMMEGIFVNNGVDITDMEDEDNEAALLKAFANIKGKELGYIETVFDAEFNSHIKTLADVLDPKLMLNELKLDITFDTFPEFITQFNVFYNSTTLGSSESLGTLLMELDVQEYSILNALETPIDSNTANTFLANIGEGDGEYGEVTIKDMIGTVYGYKYDTEMAKCLIALEELWAGPLGVSTLQLFQDVIDIMDGTVVVPDQDVAVSAKSVLIENNLVIMASTANGIIAGTAYDNMANHLTNEIANLALANVSTFVSNSVTAKIQLGTSLHKFGAIPTLRTMLSTMATNTPGGEGVLAALTEGYNISKLEAAGITSPNDIIV